MSTSGTAHQARRVGRRRCPGGLELHDWQRLAWGVNVVGADHPGDDVCVGRLCVYERWGEWPFKRGSERLVYAGRALCVERTSRLGRRFIISVR